MKRKWLSTIMVLLLIMGVTRPAQCCMAQEKPLHYQIGEFQNVKSFDEIEKLVEENSPVLKQIRLQYEGKEYEYEQARELVEDCQEQYSNSLGNDYKIQNSAREQYLSALLERELGSYYHTNRTGLIHYETLKVKQEILGLCCQILIKQKQQEYEKAQIDYLNTYKTIMQTRYKHGKTTALEVDKVTVQLEELQALYEEAGNEQKKLLDMIEMKMGISLDFSITLSVDSASKNYEQEEVIARLNKTEYSYEEAIAYRDAYTLCNSCEKAVMDSLVYKKNQAMMKMYSLEAEQIAKQITTYGKWKIKEYNTACRKLTVEKKKLTNSKTEYQNIQKKYKKGKAAKVAVYEAKAKWLEKEANYCSAICEKMLCEYGMDSGFYEGLQK